MKSFSLTLIVLLVNLSTSAQIKDTIVNATVFLPDPISKLDSIYGGIFIDNNDASSLALNKSLDTVNLTLMWDGSTFILANKAAKYSDNEMPNFNASINSSNLYLVDRSDDLFEVNNILFHLDSYRKLLCGLGFCQYWQDTIEFDAHGLNGADQSAYVKAGNYITFGTGNIDDAEDADVIIHETTHKLIDDVTNSIALSRQRAAVEEGTCDFIAHWYSKKYTSFQPNKIYNWDGHNVFWNGRVINSTKIYPSDLTGNIFFDGELWCSALNELSKVISVDTTIKLLFQSFQYWPDTASMRDMVTYLYQADTVLYQGAYSFDITNAFLSNAILSPAVKNGLNDNPIKLRLLNTEGLQYNESAIIENTDLEDLTIYIIDTKGALIYSFKSNKRAISLLPQYLPKGISFLHLTSDDSKYTFMLNR